jgi:hypothetical protein
MKGRAETRFVWSTRACLVANRFDGFATIVAPKVLAAEGTKRWLGDVNR